MNFKEKTAQRQPLIGTVLALPSPEITEMLASMDLDWLWLDMEHSVIDAPTMQRMLQATHNKIPCLVRPPSHDEVWIKKILDAGADGLLVPMVNSAEDAERIVQMSKYPPLGRRSVGIARAHNYGLGFQDHLDNANKDTTIIVQIEHIDGVKNIEAIINVPGIDGILIGPYDLSGSMGKPGKVNDDDVQKNITTARTCAQQAGKTVGIFTAGPDNVATLKEQGYDFIAVGIDSMMLGQAYEEMLRKTRGKG